MEQFTSEWQAWHDARLAALATPFGFLSVTGLHWLEQGENTWEGAPGRFDLDGDTITFRIDPGASAGPTRAALQASHAEGPDSVAVGTTADGTPWIRLPRDGDLQWLVSGHTVFEVLDRDGRAGIRIRDSKSPLLANFVDIPTFPLRESAVVSGHFTPYPEPRVRRIATAMPGLEMDRTTVGTVTFALGEATHTLTAAGSAETGLVLDFHDRTNGDTTPSWRSLDAGLPGADGTVTLDFNRTIISPFAFLPWATCPAPVEENILPLAVRAGEKDPSRTLSADGGLSHPVGVVALSGDFDLPEVFGWMEESGTHLVRQRVRRGTAVPGPVSASAFIVYGMRDAPDHADAESEAAVREFADDALAVGTPLVGIGTSGAQIVFEAARELAHSLRSVDTAAEAPAPPAGPASAADSASAVDPDQQLLEAIPMPVVVSDRVAKDRLLRGCVTICPDSSMGFIDIEALAAEVGDDTPARRRVWTDLIDRFTRLVITSG